MEEQIDDGRGRRRPGAGRLVTALAVCLTLSVGVASGAATGPSEMARVVQSAPVAAAVTGNAPAAAVPGRPAALVAYGRLPVAFEPNVGGLDPTVRYLAHGSGWSVSVGDVGTVMSLHAPAREAHASTNRPAWGRAPALHRLAAAEQQRVATVGLRPLAAAPHSVVSGTGRLPGRVNYLVGKNRTDWHSGVETFDRVLSRGIWPGVDMAWHGTNDQLEYDLDLAPGTDADAIQFEVTGTRTLSVDRSGDLLVPTEVGTLRERAPAAWQDVDGARRTVPVAYRLLGARTFGFRLGAHDPGRPVVIDPVLAWSTFLGGTGNEAGFGIATDPTGAVYVTGVTSSPTGAGITTLGPGGGFDAFVTKINPAGNAAVYTTFLGGTGTDVGLAIAVDSAGHAYVTGATTSTNFPTQSPAQAANTSSGGTAFVTELNAAGGGPVYSTYLGGTGIDRGYGIAVDPAGNAFVTGATTSSNFPKVGSSRTYGGAIDAFLTEINSAGAIAYSTFLGGTSLDEGLAVAATGPGAVYLTGVTASGGFPTHAPIQGFGGSNDAFVAEVDTVHDTLVYSTFLGGSGSEVGYGIALDPTGAAYVTGVTSGGFPTFHALQSSFGGGTDSFITKINPAGTAVVYSTYLGGSGNDVGLGIAVDPSGSPVVTGQTSGNFPTNDPFQIAGYGGGLTDAFVSRLSPDGSTLVYSSYLGGSGIEDLDPTATVKGFAGAIALDPSGAVYLTGSTTSGNFPTINPIQPNKSGTFDAFVAKIPGPARPMPPLSPPVRPHHGHRCGWPSASNDPAPC